MSDPLGTPKPERQDEIRQNLFTRYVKRAQKILKGKKPIEKGPGAEPESEMSKR